jgi:hypothetical protein
MSPDVNPQLVDAIALDQLSDRLEARGLLPHVVRRLLAGSPGVTRLEVPAEEAIGLPGFDGRVDGGAGTAWVPAGLSVWEMGVGGDPRDKAQRDYRKRTDKPGSVVPADNAFVFVTTRVWQDRKDWVRLRREEGVWRDIVVLDADRLYSWLEEMPDVHVWLSERLDRVPLRLKTLARAFDQIASRTAPALPSGLVLAGRDRQAQELVESLASPAAAIAVQAGSREEAVAFVAAALAQLPDADDHQPLVVRDAETLERLSLSQRPLVFVVANTEGMEIGSATQAGHSVILALGSGDHAGDRAIVLPRPDRSAGADALIAAGVPWEAAHRRAGLARRSFSALLRDMAVAPGGARPTWASGDDAPLLCALLLLGGWTPGQGDADVVATVAGVDVTTVDARLLIYVGSDDPPWARSAGAWHLVSPEDSWTLLHHLLTEPLLSRWQEQALAVLSEVDPRLGFDQGQRLLADVAGKHHAIYSQRLRDGIAQAAALLSGRGAEPATSGLVAAHYSTALVRRLLAEANADGSGERWSSLAPQLPLLAEAAPDAFLDAVAAGLAGDPSPLLAMFTDTPDSSPIMSPSSPHTQLLWALEGVAWSAEHLVRTVLVLGELSARAPQGRTLNRPDRSLRAILLPWRPQTAAGPQQRLAALDALRDRWPAVAWPIELSLLPKLHQTSHYTHTSRFRDWAVDRGDEPDPSAADDEAHVAALADRVGRDADRDPVRWKETIPALRGLKQQPRETLLARLDALDAEALDPSCRLELWRALVDEGESHRLFADARWSLGEAYARRLLALAERFSDPDPPERHARLFHHRVRLPDVPRDDYRAQREAVADAQREAAAAVYDSGGLAALMRLAEASRVPRAVGWAHAAGREDADIDLLLVMLGDGGARGAMAAGWLARRVRDAGAAWVDEQLAALPGLPVEAQARFMLELEPTAAAWEQIDKLNPEVQASYWRSVDPYALQPDDLTAGVARLLAVDRPWAAIDVLAGSVHDGSGIDIELADRALEAAAASGELDASVDPGYEVGQLLDSMERSGAPIERLAAHEFTFFALLDQEREPRALAAAIADDPGLFVSVVRHAYRCADGADEPDVRTELATHAWHVLEGLHRVPGTRDDCVDRDALAEWVHLAREELAATDRVDIGDECLGQLLARAPAEPDDVWPPVAVRAVIETVASDHLESGIENGHVKARGVTMRGIYAGGGQERGMAAELRRDAATMDVRWSRTARMLRSLADTYDSFAAHEDRQAQHAADDDR